VPLAVAGAAGGWEAAGSAGVAPCAYAPVAAKAMYAPATACPANTMVGLSLKEAAERLPVVFFTSLSPKFCERDDACHPVDTKCL
jgi:hypothetical protein